MKIDYAELSVEERALVHRAHYEYTTTGSMATDTLISLRTAGLDPDALEDHSNIKLPVHVKIVRTRHLHRDRSGRPGRRKRETEKVGELVPHTIARHHIVLCSCYGCFILLFSPIFSALTSIHNTTITQMSKQLVHQ